MYDGIQCFQLICTSFPSREKGERRKNGVKGEERE